MTPGTSRPSLRQQLFLFFLSLCLALLATSANAQDGGLGGDPSDSGTGGNNTILGRVYYPSGREVDKRMRVRISSVRGGENSTSTNDSGRFAFRGLANGTYHITVEGGRDFRPANEQVDFAGGSNRRFARGEVITLQIQLRLASGVSNKAEVVDSALAGAPEAAVKLYKKASDAASTGNDEKAIEQLKKAVAIYPEFALAFNELGVHYMKLGQFDKASDSFKSALAITPDDFNSRLSLGIALMYLKRLREAEVQLRKAVTINGASASAHYFLGRTLAVLRNFDEAEKELTQAVKAGGEEVAGAHRFLGAIFQARGDNVRAIKELETYVRLVPAAPDKEQILALIKELRSREHK